MKELNEAKAVVPEPPQPKIKLKMTPGQETPAAGAKKITIHVGGSRGSAAASPAPQTGQSSDSGQTDAVVDRSRGVQGPGENTTNASFQPDNKGRASGSPSAMGATPAQRSAAVVPRPDGDAPNAMQGPNGIPAPGQNPQQGLNASQLQNGHAAAAPIPGPLVHDKKYRAPGRGRTLCGNLIIGNMGDSNTVPPGLADALLPSVLVRTHPSIAIDRRFRLEIPAHPKEAQQNISVHIPAIHSRLQLIPRLAPLEQQGRPYRLYVSINGQTVGRATPLPVPEDPLPVNAMVFDLGLQYFTNIIMITVIAALPKGQKLPNGADCEVERMTINAHLLRGY